MANFRQSKTVADSAGGNGNYPSAAGVQVDGGEYLVHIKGSFEGATLTLQMGLDGSSFVSLTEGVFTAPNTDFRLTAPRNAYVRGVVSGSGSPSPDIDVTLEPIPNEGFWGQMKQILTNILTRDILSKVFHGRETDEVTARADNTEITCDSTFVTADGLIRE